jgi:dTDP-glucose pyrophosphorylase
VVGKHGKLLMDYMFERNITIVFQDEPKGFGNAVLRAEDFASNEPFFVHADDGVLTGGYREAKSLFEEINPEMKIRFEDLKKTLEECINDSKE